MSARDLAADLDLARRWVRRFLPSNLLDVVLPRLEPHDVAPWPSASAGHVDTLPAPAQPPRASVASPQHPSELAAALRRAFDAGEVADTELMRSILAQLEREAAEASARAVGAAKARAIRRANKEAAVSRHTWKTPLTAPDFVERVLQNFAVSGEQPPSARFIRTWRDAQISNRHHNASAGGYAATSTSSST